jgi:hypothetical protein
MRIDSMIHPGSFCVNQMESGIRTLAAGSPARIVAGLMTLVDHASTLRFGAAIAGDVSALLTEAGVTVGRPGRT